jgi:polyhydroxybutyrate depolymerase
MNDRAASCAVSKIATPKNGAANCGVIIIPRKRDKIDSRRIEAFIHSPNNPRKLRRNYMTKKTIPPTVIGFLLAAGLLAGGCTLPNPRGGSAPVQSANASLEPGESIRQISTGGQVREFRLHVPPSYVSGQAIPLIVNLHGFDSNAAQEETVSRMSVRADSAGFIAAYPEGLGKPQAWHFGSLAEAKADVQFIRDLVGALENAGSIDPKRIYVTGISNGAEMSYRLACDAADVFAAFAPVSGAYQKYGDCNPGRPVPAVAFHGTDDKLLPYAGIPPLFLPVHDWAVEWAARNGCGSAPAITYQNGDVTGESWSSCQQGADVVLYTIQGKGHSWPGSNMPAAITTRDIDATDVMWDFFAAHPMP